MQNKLPESFIDLYLINIGSTVFTQSFLTENNQTIWITHEI
jgi:hypothetical protein